MEDNQTCRVDGCHAVGKPDACFILVSSIELHGPPSKADNSERGDAAQKELQTKPSWMGIEVAVVPGIPLTLTEALDSKWFPVG